VKPIPLGPESHVIVTGGAGFIGSRLTSWLLDRRAEVTVLTRHTAAPRALELAARGARLIACDLSTPQGIPALPALRRPDVVIHLAADVSVSGPTLTAVNVDGTTRALALAEALDVPYFVFASSIEAQGPGGNHEIPLREEAPCRPVSDYGRSKASAEQLVTAWEAATGRGALVLRIGNIYGPGSAWLLQPSLLALLGATPIRHVWPLLRPRRFQPLYVDDLVEGLARAASQRLTGVYNITGEEPVTIAQYFEELAGLLGLGAGLAAMIRPDAAPAPPPDMLAPDFAYLLMGDPERRHRSYDNGRLRSAIGVYARWSLPRGLASTLHWYEACGALAALVATLRQRRNGVAAAARGVTGPQP
jgi:nucleoside-diphosphate-sugar epimerase